MSRGSAAIVAFAGVLIAALAIRAAVLHVTKYDLVEAAFLIISLPLL
jgi:hypothetical protein